MKRSVIATLSLTDIFDNLNPAQLELVAALCEPVSLRRQEVLFRENEGSDDLYVIVRGEVDVLVDPGLITARPQREPVVLTTLRAGQVFGEIALVDQGLRSATARAGDGSAELLRIARGRMMLLCDTYPELGYKIMRNLAADLAMKIRNTGLTIRQYQLLLSTRPEPPRG